MADIRRDIGQAGPVLNQGVSGSQAGQSNIAAGASMLGGVAASLQQSAPAPRSGLSEAKLFDIAKEKEETRLLGEAFVTAADTLGIVDPVVMDGAGQMAALEDAKKQGTMKRSLAELRQAALAKQIMSKYAGDTVQIGHFVQAMKSLGVEPIKSIIEERDRLEQDQINRAEKERERQLTYAAKHDLLVFGDNGAVVEDETMANVAKYSAQVSADASEAYQRNKEQARINLTKSRLEVDKTLSDRATAAADKVYGHGLRELRIDTAEQIQAVREGPGDPIAKKQAIGNIIEQAKLLGAKSIQDNVDTYGLPSDTLIPNFNDEMNDLGAQSIKIVDGQIAAPQEKLARDEATAANRLYRDYPQMQAVGALRKSLGDSGFAMFSDAIGLSDPQSPLSQGMIAYLEGAATGPKALDDFGAGVDAGVDKNKDNPQQLKANFKQADNELLARASAPITSAEDARKLATHLATYLSISRYMDPADKEFVVDRLMAIAPKIKEARELAMREGDINTVELLDLGIQKRITSHLDDMNQEQKVSFGFTPNQTKVGVVFDEEQMQFREAPMGDPKQFLITDLRSAIGRGVSDLALAATGQDFPPTENPLIPVQYTGPNTIYGRNTQRFSDMRSRRIGDVFGGEVIEADQFSKKLNAQYMKLVRMFQEGGFEQPEVRAAAALGVDNSGTPSSIPTAGALRAGGLDPMQSEDLEVVQIGNNVYLRPKRGTEQSAARLVGQAVESLSDAAFGAMGFDPELLSRNAQRRADSEKK